MVTICCTWPKLKEGCLFCQILTFNPIVELKFEIRVPQTKFQLYPMKIGEVRSFSCCDTWNEDDVMESKQRWRHQLLWSIWSKHGPFDVTTPSFNFIWLEIQSYGDGLFCPVQTVLVKVAGNSLLIHAFAYLLFVGVSLVISDITDDPACILKCQLKLQGWMDQLHRKPNSTHFFLLKLNWIDLSSEYQYTFTTLIYHCLFPIWRLIITPNGIQLSENFKYFHM